MVIWIRSPPYADCYIFMLTRNKVSLITLAVLLSMGGLFLVPSVRNNTQGAWKKVRNVFGFDTVELSHARERIRSLYGVNATLPLPQPRIRINKSDLILELYSEGRLIKTYPIALGGQPIGPKEKKGDGKTPTGEYFICTRNGITQFHLFLGINYPNSKDAKGAVERGLISVEDEQRIEEAEKSQECPPWDGPLGGAIGIHGGGTGRNWTWGCIALEDAAVEEIWVSTQMGTPVTIKE